MYSFIVRIDGEFEIVELKNGLQKVCPAGIFPNCIKTDDVVKLEIIKNENIKINVNDEKSGTF